MNRATCRGFTVVEMMTVVGILFVVIALAIPAASRAKFSAQRAQCLSHLRSVQMAHLAYMAEHRGRFVHVDEYMPHGGLSDEEMGASSGHEQPIWYFMLQEYYDTPLVLKSPLDDSKHWPRSLGGQGVPIGNGAGLRRTSYGMNDYLSPQTNPLHAITGDNADIFNRLSKVPSPTNTVNFLIIAFTGPNAGSDHIDSAWLDSTMLPVEQVAADWIQTNAHSGAERSWDARSGYAFLDGHVATQRFSEIVMPEFSGESNMFNPRAAVSMAAMQFGNE